MGKPLPQKTESSAVRRVFLWERDANLRQACTIFFAAQRVDHA